MREVLHWLSFPQQDSVFHVSDSACLAERSPTCASFVLFSLLVHTVHSILVVPFAHSATTQSHSFSVVGPTTWNSIPSDLRHLPNGASFQFDQLLKTVLLRLARVESASEKRSWRDTIYISIDRLKLIFIPHIYLKRAMPIGHGICQINK